MIACSAPVDTALQALRLQVRLDLRGSRCPPTPRCRCWRDRADRLASDCHARPRPSYPICGSACAPCPRRVVLVAVEALIVPLRPARVLVLLGILGGLLFPSLGRLAGLDRLVLLLG